MSLVSDPLLLSCVTFVCIQWQYVVRFCSKPGTNLLAGMPVMLSGIIKSIIKTMYSPAKVSFDEMVGCFLVAVLNQLLEFVKQGLYAYLIPGTIGSDRSASRI